MSHRGERDSRAALEPLFDLRRDRVPDRDRDRDREHPAHARRRHPRHERGRPRRAAARVRGPGAARFPGGRRERLPGRLRDRRQPVPRRRDPHPGVRGRPAGGDPRLRPLRPPAGDLVLVHRRRRLPADPGRLRPRSPPGSAAGSTSSRSTSATTATTRRRSSASAAGGCRWAGTPTAPSPTSTGSACCPTVAFAYPGGLFSEAKLGADELSEQQLTEEVERLVARVRAARGGGPVSEPAIEEGWVAPELREEFPGLGLRTMVVSAARAARPRR